MNQSQLDISSYQNCSQYHVDSTISFTGKERNEETGYSYFGARYYDADLLTGWMSVDPMAGKYPSISPYAYCTWNPIKLVDPNGEDVLPTSEDAYQMILMTIPESAREYIRCNKDGYIDRDLINLYDCESSNFRDLKELVNNVCVIEVTIADAYTWADKDGNLGTTKMEYQTPSIEAELNRLFNVNTVPPPENKGPYSLSTEEAGEMGITLFPTQLSGRQSTNENIQIIVNSNLSFKGRVETFAHEFFGHAYIYATSCDVSRATHNFSQDRKDLNLELKTRIISSQNETYLYQR